jgi:hypothetical protein
MGALIGKMIMDFCVAFGVVMGASLLSGIGAVLTFQPPSHHMRWYANQIKIWALVAAIGGTIDPIRVIESNLLESQLSPVFQQILRILSAFVGAHCGYVLIQWITGGGKP